MGDARADIRLIREALGRARSNIHANPDPWDAFADASELSALGEEIRTDAGHMRADRAWQLKQRSGRSTAQLGKTLGLSKPGIGRLIRIGKGREGAA